MAFDNATMDATANSLGGVVFPLIILAVVLLAMISMGLFALSQRFHRLGGVIGFFAKQLRNAALGLIPATALLALGAAVYGAASMSGEARETTSLGVGVGLAGFVALALLGAAWRRVLAQVRRVHPSWFHTKQDERGQA